ncbi:fimbrial biogenesis outer membrane usher protein [Shigella flexneri]
MVLTGSGMLRTTANAEEYYFDPDHAGNTQSGMQRPIRHVFQKNMHNYQELIRLISADKRRFHRKKLHLPPMQSNFCSQQFTVEQLRELGIKVDEIPALAEKDDDSVINSLEHIISGTAGPIYFNHQRLKFRKHSPNCTVP